MKKSKYCFHIGRVVPFQWYPTIDFRFQRSFYDSKGGIMFFWLNFYIKLRRPEGDRIIPTIDGKPCYKPTLLSNIFGT
jgi:hypothetical protein